MTPPTNPDGGRLGLLEICEALHMDNTGSGDLEYGRYTREQLGSYLKWRLDNWKRSSECDYDRVVFSLCSTVLAERSWRNS